MSLSTCKCGKVFDSDYQLGSDDKGNCCCDECFEALANEMESDIGKVLDKIEKSRAKFSNLDIAGTMTDYLLNENYRKVR